MLVVKVVSVVFSAGPLKVANNIKFHFVKSIHSVSSKVKNLNYLETADGIIFIYIPMDTPMVGYNTIKGGEHT